MKLNRDEMLACIITLEKQKKPSRWSNSALKKLLSAMNMKPRLSA